MEILKIAIKYSSSFILKLIHKASV
jgi:hypothetical protein